MYIGVEIWSEFWASNIHNVRRSFFEGYTPPDFNAQEHSARNSKIGGQVVYKT